MPAPQVETTRPRNYTNAQIGELSAFLQGTPQSLEEALNVCFGDDHADMTHDDHLELDQEVFECERCGWWCEISQMSEKEDCASVCEDCEDDE